MSGSHHQRVPITRARRGAGGPRETAAPPGEASIRLASCAHTYTPRMGKGQGSALIDRSATSRLRSVDGSHLAYG